MGCYNFQKITFQIFQNLKQLQNTFLIIFCKLALVNKRLFVQLWQLSKPSPIQKIIYIKKKWYFPKKKFNKNSEDKLTKLNCKIAHKVFYFSMHVFSAFLINCIEERGTLTICVDSLQNHYSAWQFNSLKPFKTYVLVVVK